MCLPVPVLDQLAKDPAASMSFKIASLCHLVDELPDVAIKCKGWTLDRNLRVACSQWLAIHARSRPAWFIRHLNRRWQPHWETVNSCPTMKRSPKFLALTALLLVSHDGIDVQASPALSWRVIADAATVSSATLDGITYQNKVSFIV